MGHDRRLQAETERAAYRIVQEALTNIARHAEATSGGVHLTTDPASLTITIEDNGVGFDVADVERPGKRRGLGLLSIRERVAGLRRNGAHRERCQAVALASRWRCPPSSRLELTMPTRRWRCSWPLAIRR